jgi:SAM-dependent methyltransferase
MQCKVCQGMKISKLYTVKNYDIWRCLDCGFGQVFISPQEIAAFYDQGYFKGEKASFAQEEETQAGPAHGYWLEKQLSFFPRGAALQVLEIGPGLGGQFAGYLQEHYPQVTYEAVEISDFASERLKARGFTIHTGKISDPKVLKECEGRFDLVIGTEVIEHDPDPKPFVESVYRMLKPGGRCAFTTGNLDGWIARIRREKWYYLDPPAHVSFYTPESAKLLFRGAGFPKVSIWKVGFNYINLKLKTHLPGILFLADLLSIPTGMVISATR